ncbi:M14 family zinc carboxypeptidase [Namhaeicola litoreus]|uniref:M14 family zinc carboxypeptidase n=1 Tax=Namhaeicola litoreus TaxID=1052145 RepID=A0ABW3XYI8_9FLAO
MLKKIPYRFCFLFFIFLPFQGIAQDYFFKEYSPFDSKIPSPEEYLGYPIGEYHTRHDLVVSYLEKLASMSDRVTVFEYGRTHEQRKLVMAIITNKSNHDRLEEIKRVHLEVVDPDKKVSSFTDLPLIVNLGYNVHGNEPSSTEAAMLTAYTLAASSHPKVDEILSETVVFLDPTINPDGRDRHTQWVNSRRGQPFIADKNDIEHNEGWPNGRTNHYWFDLNRDLLLAVHPESKAKLKWYHEWYPNVVTDFHEMGTNSTYFFEPKNQSASLVPITPKENYTTLNNLFAKQFAADLDQIGSLYFTAEVYDSTYPGYGSTYGDLQGSLALLFEQASARGHLQETPTGEITFAFAIRNQFISSFSTLKAAVENKQTLYDYQSRFFQEAIDKASKSKVKAYVFGDPYDTNRNKAFLEVLLTHKIKVYQAEKDLDIDKRTFKKDMSYIVPVKQQQYYMVQSLFETFEKYRDSVYYDTSAWSLVNAFNLPHAQLNKLPNLGNEITKEFLEKKNRTLQKSNYAYLIDYADYNAPSFLYFLQDKGLIAKTTSKPLTTVVEGKNHSFGRGSIMLSVQDQKITSDELYEFLLDGSNDFDVQVYPIQTGMTVDGNGLGSRSLMTVKKPEVMLLVGEGISPYEAGEVWHLMEQRLKMPLVKIDVSDFDRADLNRYNAIVMVSGSYNVFGSAEIEKLKNWVGIGNTLITTRTANTWIIKNKLVDETLVEKSKDTTVQRVDYGLSDGFIGRNNIGGAIFEVDLDITHPIGFGYSERTLPVYKNNTVWLNPSKNNFSTVARYTDDPHIDGFITPENLALMEKSASIIVSNIGKGRVVMFADNPNFRGIWYGTNKLFTNAIMFGSIIEMPK